MIRYNDFLELIGDVFPWRHHNDPDDQPVIMRVVNPEQVGRGEVKVEIIEPDSVIDDQNSMFVVKTTHLIDGDPKKGIKQFYSFILLDNGVLIPTPFHTTGDNPFLIKFD